MQINGLVSYDRDLCHGTVNENTFVEYSRLRENRLDMIYRDYVDNYSLKAALHYPLIQINY